uniref:phage portal protein n=1 Tax=Micrococcus sp. F3Y TaxID=3402627 RepID=UPI003AF6127F
RRATFVQRGKDWTEDKESRDEHDGPSTRVVAFPNKQRLLRMDGMPEFAGVLPTLDAINKMATDMMISGEFHAMPRRFAFGLSKEDFQDENGKQLSVWQQLAGGVWASEANASEVKVGQFEEADLKVFHDSIKLLLAVTFMQVALPSHISAFQGDNPTSEPAIKAAEIQKTKRAERKQTFIGGGLVEVMRDCWSVMGRPADELRGLEVNWRNPATPTRAQEADAAVKLVQAGVIPPQQARVDLNYSPAQMRQMEAWDKQNASDPFFERTMRDTGPSGARWSMISAEPPRAAAGM